MRSAMRAASQLPGRGPTVVDIAPVPTCTLIKNPMMMMRRRRSGRRKGKTCIRAQFHSTDLVICSHSRKGKNLSHS